MCSNIRKELNLNYSANTSYFLTSENILLFLLHVTIHCEVTVPWHCQKFQKGACPALIIPCDFILSKIFIE